MNRNELTKQLIAIPSFVDENTNEQKLVEFLIQYVEKNLPWLTVTLQNVEDGRKNLLLKDSGETKLLVIDQIDTVRPAVGWETKPCVPVEKNGRIYGLGASDSKGNVAAFLKALEYYGPTSGFAMLLYVDEEYVFKGMKTFAESELAKTMSPKDILSIDGNGLVVGRGCRGLIEIDCMIETLSGHSANPSTVGAINQGLKLLEELREWLTQFSDEFLGKPSLNIGGIRGGFVVEDDAGKEKVAFVGNQIANKVEMKIEVRTVPGLQAADVVQYMWDFAQKTGVKLEANVFYDLSSFSTDRAHTSVIQKASKNVLGNVGFLNPGTFGYLDLAMLQEVYTDANLYSFGVGEPGVNHKANEYIPTENLEKGQKVYEEFLKEYFG